MATSAVGEVLTTALAAVVSNAGSAGVDGVATEQVKADSAVFLDALESALRSKSYRPSPVLRVWIPKADGKQRPLGIPTVKDRVVQAALVLLLQPIFAADFNEGSFGYRNRPGFFLFIAFAGGLFVETKGQARNCASRLT